jgi:tripartite-type tricarboxylate transporter receptor subunit TctC
MRSNRNSVVKGLAYGGMSLLFLLGMVTVSVSQDYPNRPVIIHTGMAPGAAAGIIAQIFSEGMEKYVGKSQQFVVNYRVGASGMMSVDYFMKQPADGYNLVWINPMQVARLATHGQQYSFGKDDLNYIGTLGSAPYVFAVLKDSPYKTFDEFIAAAKKNPGELSYGHPGVAGDTHLYMEWLLSMIGIKLTAVPFTGGAPAVTALLGGHVTCYMGSTVTLGSHIKPEGKLRVLASLTAKRLPDFPDAPTCGEKGYDVGDLGTFQLVAARKGTPKPIMDILVDGYKKTAADPNVKASLTKAGFLALEWGPEETEKKVTREFGILRDVYKKLGLQVK